MRLILLLTANTIRSWLRNPVPLLIMMLFPLALLGILYTGLQPLLKEKQWIEPFPVAIVDNEQTFETKLLLTQYQKSEDLKKLMKFSVLSEEKAEQQLKSNQVAGVAIIPEGFTESLWTGKNIPVEVISNEKRGFQAKLFRQFMATNTKLISAAQAGANGAYHYSKKLPITEDELKQQRKQIAATLTLHALDRNQFFTEETVTAFGGTNQKNFYALSGVLLLLIITGLFAIKMTRREEQQVLQDRLALYGLTHKEFAWSSFGSSVFLFTLQAAVLSSMFYLLTDTWSWGAIALTLLYVIALAAGFSLLTEILSNENAALGAAILFTSANAALSGILFPVSLLPEALQPFSSWTLMNIVQEGLLKSLFSSGELPVGAALKLAAASVIMLAAKQLLIKLKKRDLWAEHSQSPSTAYDS